MTEKEANEPGGGAADAEKADAAADAGADAPDGGSADTAAGGAEPAGASTAEGGIEIDHKLDFEVHLLAIAAIRGISGDIANRVKAWVGEDKASIILADDEALAAMADWRILSTRMAALEIALKSAVGEARRRAATAGRLESLEQGSGVESAAIVGGIGGVTAVAKAASELLSWFAVNTKWEGRDVEVGAALRPALLGQLLALDIEPVTMSPTPPAGAPSEDDKTLAGGLLRLLKLKAELDTSYKPAPPGKLGPAPAQGGGDEAAEDAGADDTDEDPLKACVAALTAELTAVQEAIRAEKPGVSALLAASEACAIADGPNAAYLLQAKVLKAGGRYKLRKHLLTYLFGMNGLTYSAGAAVTFTLTDMKSRRVVLADTLFHASDEMRFAGVETIITPSNLVPGPKSDPGLYALPVRKRPEKKAEPVNPEKPES